MAVTEPMRRRGKDEWGALTENGHCAQIPRSLSFRIGRPHATSCLIPYSQCNTSILTRECDLLLSSTSSACARCVRLSQATILRPASSLRAFAFHLSIHSVEYSSRGKCGDCSPSALFSRVQGIECGTTISVRYINSYLRVRKPSTIRSWGLIPRHPTTVCCARRSRTIRHSSTFSGLHPVGTMHSFPCSSPGGIRRL